MIDISELEQKRNNDAQADAAADIPKEEKLSAAEFVNLIVAPIKELQAASQGNVKGIKVGSQVITPNADGIVPLPSEASVVDILTDVDASQPIVSIDGKVNVNLQVFSSSAGRYNSHRVKIEVWTANLGSTSFVKQGDFEVMSMPGSATNYYNVDLAPYLKSISQQVRLVGTDLETAATDGNLLFSEITVSVLSLSFATDWSKPQTGSLNLSYYVGGAVQKFISVKVDGIIILDKSSVGTNPYLETPYTLAEITDARVLSHGVHKIEAWLTTGDKETDHIFNEVYLLADDSDTNTYLTVNNLATTAQPYVDMEMFKYCLFKKDAEYVPFIVRATNADGSIQYLNDDRGSVKVGERTSYFNSLNIDSKEETIPVYLYFYTKDEEDREVPLKTDYSFISVDNSNNFAPTEMQSSGFILNPKNRSNSQINPKSIINERTGQEIPSTWEGFDLVNDGYVDGVLRIPAGRKLSFAYHPFSALTTANSTASLTMEFDVTISNLRSYVGENSEILRVGSIMPNDSKVLGWQMFPLRAHLLTQNKRKTKEQDIQWQEDERVHIGVNIVYNLAERGVNYVRIFINGVINREFEYDNTDIFAQQNEGFTIGSDYADIDIHSIYVYKQALSSQQMQQNHLASLSNAEDKLAFQSKNDILGDDNTISLSKAQARGYNTLRFIADDTAKNLIANYTNKGNNLTKGTVEMMVYNVDGTPKRKYCQRITHCKQKGQGTSSMTYYGWNITYSATADSQRFVLDDNNEWVLDESVSGEDCYFIFPNGLSSRADIKGLKNVAKRNWASSMQSHKMGWCNLYTDLYWECIGNSNINSVQGYENVRKSVTQLPFLLFIGAESIGYRYDGVMTFGPAKFDKLCWGTKAPSPHYVVDGKNASMFTALEGSANGRPLPERKIPWLTDEVFYYLNRSNGDDALNECLVYNNEPQLDVDKSVNNVYEAKTDNEYEIPKGFTAVNGSSVLWQETEDMEYDSTDIYKCRGGNTIKFFRRAYNNDYLHSNALALFSGTVVDLRSATDLDKGKQYWVTQASGSTQVYDLFRWNPLTSSWVNAGAAHDANTDDGYARLNLMTQCEGWLAEYHISFNTANPLQMNEAFIAAREADYKKTSMAYYDEADVDFSQAFRKFGALKDNWCKNTYETLQPNGLISEDSDDNDTSGDLDNVGASTTPYFVEEHDRCDIDFNFDPNGSKTYWDSETNVRYCLREASRGEEICNMLQQMMNSMADIGGSVMGCMDKYFFSTQRYIPATAYNENARIMYEAASVAMKNKEYTNAVDPLSQNLGDHLQSELEFWKKRIAYLGSWCRCNEFTNNQGSGTFSFRTARTENTFQFTVTAHQAIYPAMMVDGVLRQDISKHRMLPGDTYKMDRLVVNTQYITVFLCGIDYYTSIGDLTGMPIRNTGALNVVGKRLVDFVADGADGMFCPTGITFVAPRLQVVSVTNVASLSGAPNLSSCINIREINLQGNDGITGITLPNAPQLQSLHLPSRLTDIKVEYQESLTSFSIQSTDYLLNTTITQSADIVAHEILSKL